MSEESQDRSKMHEPVMIKLGEGRIGITTFSGTDGSKGLLFTDTGRESIIGELTGQPADENHIPSKGESYISCANRESALVLLEQAARVVAWFTDGDSA